ncbi:cytosine permease [Clostridium sp. AM58-1XD]|uniref:cytosine permease n=1 Tax=Clostridium sp. AM58-1XD TaxID=2292307 RepID=UPI000E4DDC36|nr:cytosine permease [Clostridium sp. AM58-1XD]RGY98682.1 hypothetical protein DXA13_09980 [Clostridium sp. AM58-1XD]
MIGFQAKTEHDLYNESLAPVEYNKRKVGYLGMGAIWFGISVQVSGFLVMTPLLNYYTIGQLFWIFGIGQAILGLSSYIVQEIGLKYGISFATSIVASFGPLGGKIAGIVRIMPSAIFFGVNGYLGASAINNVTRLLFGMDNMWFAIILNAALLVIVTISGAKGIERFTSLAAPLLIIVGVYMFHILLKTYNVTLGEIMSLGKLSGHSRNWLFAFGVIIGNFASVAMGFNDFSKDGKVKDGYKKSGYLHLTSYLICMVPSFIFYSILGCAVMVVVPGTTGGEILKVLTDIVAGQSKILAVLISVFVFAAQLSTNTAANLLPSVYVVCSLIPKYLKFKSATILFAVIAVAIQPWKIGNSLDSVLTIFGLTAGPVIAIIATDYYYFRKRKYSLDDIYQTNGKYYYFHGMNPAAMIAYVIGTIIAFICFDYSYFISLAATCLIYILLAKYFGKTYPAIIKETAKDIKIESEDLK